MDTKTHTYNYIYLYNLQVFKGFITFAANQSEMDLLIALLCAKGFIQTKRRAYKLNFTAEINANFPLREELLSFDNILMIISPIGSALFG